MDRRQRQNFHQLKSKGKLIEETDKMEQDAVNVDLCAALLKGCAWQLARREGIRGAKHSDEEQLTVDCALGRVLKATEAFCPEALRDWLKTPEGSQVRDDYNDLMRLTVVEEAAKAVIGKRAGDYTLGTILDVLRAVEQIGAPRASASSRRGRKLKQQSGGVRASRELSHAQHRVSSKSREAARAIAAEWRRSRDPAKLDALKAIAQQVGISPIAMIERVFEKSPGRTVLMKAATARFSD